MNRHAMPASRFTNSRPVTPKSRHVLLTEDRLLLRLNLLAVVPLVVMLVLMARVVGGRLGGARARAVAGYAVVAGADR